jgi:hypothetical protein
MSDSDQLARFMQGMAAATFLLDTAIEKRSALECIVLLSNLIDGALRVGLILRRQLDNATNEIDVTLLAQTDGDRAMSERSIYKACLEGRLIDASLFEALTQAYDKRNKCIHRYLLSEIDYDYATSLVFELDSLLRRIRGVIWLLEDEQIQRGVGMTVAAGLATKEFLREFASEKEKSHNLGGD